MVNIPALIFHPAIFSFSMKLMILLSPVIGKMATLLLGKDKKVDSLDFELTTMPAPNAETALPYAPHTWSPGMKR